MAVILQHKARRLDAAATILGHAHTIFLAAFYNMLYKALKVNWRLDKFFSDEATRTFFCLPLLVVKHKLQERLIFCSYAGKIFLYISQEKRRREFLILLVSFVNGKSLFLLISTYLDNLLRVLHCEKYRNFTWFPGVEILRKGTSGNKVKLRYFSQC